MSVSLTGKDTIIIDNRIFTDLAEGDTAMLDFPNNLVEAKIGKNKNVIFAFNSSGKTVTVTLRVLVGSPDDKYLNSRMAEFINDPPTFILHEGEFIKRSGDGIGNSVDVIYTMNAGIIQKFPNTKENVSGDTEQSVAVWQLQFANTERKIA